MKPYRFTRVAVRWITRFQVRHALDAQAAATLIEIDLLRQEHKRALNAQHDRIESALSAALGDPDLGAYPGDPDGAPDLESLIAMVAGLRRQRDEARRERDEMAAAGRMVVEAMDEMREQWAEIEARLEGERAALLAAQERDANLVRHAVMAIRHSDRKPRRPLWAHVCDAFAIGSTRAHELCIRFGRYPDVML